MTHTLHRHDDTFLTLEQTRTDMRFAMPYRKTFDFAGDAINKHHAELSARIASTGMIDYGVEGWLLPQDAQKLYELAYFCGGDILELGTYRGLSASVMSSACHDSGRENVIVSIDLDPDAIRHARANLRGRPGCDRVHIFQEEGATGVRNLAKAKRQFNFAFIDHSHEYDHVYEACKPLHRVLALGAFALFHDFNDGRNAAPDQPDYGVYQGVLDGLDPRRFEFWGIYGCCGLFRRIGSF